MRLATLMFAVLASGPATATLLVGTGESTTVSAESENVFLRMGGRAQVVSGGVVRGSAEAGQTGAITIVDSLADFSPPTRSKVHVLGDGKVIGDTGQYGISMLRSVGTVTLSDSAYVGHGNGVSDAIWVQDSYAIRLDMSNRALVDGDVRWNGYVTMSESATILGGLRDENGKIDLRMDGGLIAGEVRMTSAGDHHLEMEGGSILGGVYVGYASGFGFKMEGGRIAGGLTINGASSSTRVYGGRIDGGISALERIGDRILLYGGEFDTSTNGWLLDVTQTDIWPDWSHLTPSEIGIFGGQFGYTNAGQGFRFGGATNFTAYGLDLSFANGYLTGFLSDGSWINVPLTFTSDWIGSFNIVKYDARVPLPGSLGLLGTAAFAMFLIGRARRREGASRELPEGITH